MQVFFAGEGKAGENKNLSVFAYVEVFWWSEVNQIRTIALWGIFGGNFIESDGFCAVFVVECNQNFFIIEINSMRLQHPRYHRSESP